MKADSRIFVAGHQGLVGSAIVRRLGVAGFGNLVVRNRSQLDLANERAVDAFFAEVRPDYVFLAAAKVGGILANSRYPADFMRENLAIQSNVIAASHRNGVQKLLFLGSSCIYPRDAPQPMSEDCLLTGALEQTNEAYAVAKIAGLKMCQAYRRQYGFNAIGVMPTNLYGPGDNFSLDNSHVVPALLRKFDEAKESRKSVVEVWGTGKPRREFLHVDDLADASLFLIEKYDEERPINVGWGRDQAIAEVALTIGRVVGFEGSVVFDSSKPDGTPRKLLDTTRLRELGWTPQIEFEVGIRSTYAWFTNHKSSLRM